MSVSVVSPVFIGRREELTSLATLMAQAQAREPAFALIGGEAGVSSRCPPTCSAAPTAWPCPPP